jgi:glycerophosphoryl diester phosphodiesterase
MRSLWAIFVFWLCTLAAGTSVAQYILPAPKNGPVYVIAHRGAHIGIPENSLPAYQKAIELGCDFVEIDVRTTSDNELVSIHNTTIDAYVTGETGKVMDMTLAQLKQLDIGLKYGEIWKNTSIPTLEEILQLCYGKIGIYLDLKDGDPEQIIALLKKYNMESRTVWYVPASRHKTLMEIKQYCDACLVMPDPVDITNLETVFAAYNPKMIASDMKHFNKEFGQKMREYQALVFVDENERDPSLLLKQWQQMIEWGVDGIQTDDPEKLIRFLKD